MNERFHHSSKMRLKSILQEFGFIVRSIESHIAGQDQMEIGMNAVPRTPGSEPVNVNPVGPAMPGNEL